MTGRAPTGSSAIGNRCHRSAGGVPPWQTRRPCLARDGDGHRVEFKKPWERVRAAAGCDDVRVHDLRRSIATEMARRGGTASQIQQALGYNPLDPVPWKPLESRRNCHPGAPAAAAARVSGSPSIRLSAGEPATWTRTFEPGGSA